MTEEESSTTALKKQQESCWIWDASQNMTSVGPKRTVFIYSASLMSELRQKTQLLVQTEPLGLFQNWKSAFGEPAQPFINSVGCWRSSACAQREKWADGTKAVGTAGIKRIKNKHQVTKEKGGGESGKAFAQVWTCTSSWFALNHPVHTHEVCSCHTEPFLK